MIQKHVVIDARLYGPKHTGNGRYTKNLLICLDKLIPKYPNLRFTAIVYSDLLDEVKKDTKNFTLVPTDIKTYSLAEQFVLPNIIRELKPNLLHVTHFNKSVFYTGKSVVTIHDLIKHFFKGKETTTKNPLLYWIKYLAYRLVVKIVIKTSSIIVPSNYWRDYLIKNYSINPCNIITTYEAVDPKFLTSSTTFDLQPKKYILYTGNLYPHKNIKVIFEALKSFPDYKLKIISARTDVFTKRLESMIFKYDVRNQVEILGYVPDQDFKNLYSQALALVHPSFMEGFSLTGLEAMALNCPVIASNTSCMPEIYGDSVLYFNPNSSIELVKQIKLLINSPDLRRQLIQKGRSQVAKYSWDNTAKETMAFYLDILSCKK